MSFVAAFYSFGIELNNPDNQRFEKFRVKTALHPNEGLEHLYARMLAYIHCYRPGQEFSHGLFEPKQPTIWQKDITGEFLLWANVGELEIKKLEVALRNGDQCEYRVYFYSPEQIVSFCHHLRGSKTNWVEKISFYLIPLATIESLNATSRSSAQWTVTAVDNYLYLICDGLELNTHIETIDIWAAYQTSIGNVASANN